MAPVTEKATTRKTATVEKSLDILIFFEWVDEDFRAFIYQYVSQVVMVGWSLGFATTRE